MKITKGGVGVPAGPAGKEKQGKSARGKTDFARIEQPSEVFAADVSLIFGTFPTIGAKNSELDCSWPVAFGMFDSSSQETSPIPYNY